MERTDQPDQPPTPTQILTAATVIGTLAVLAPIPPRTIRGLYPTAGPLKATPAPVPASDGAQVAAVSSFLGLPHWRPRPEVGETETRVLMWSQLELNALYERIGGTVTSRQVEHTTSDGRPWTEEEITVTVDVPGVGLVQAVTGWCDTLAKHGPRNTLALTRALPRPAVTV
ncbi:hypothetical protein ACIO02_34075 [Streptomyces sp. NPDC087568]|uniref:hypothetical protein n=1 Tax=unclassified Streptomyces TaxID=2593676 RepID=UPI0036E08EA9